ncbi:hypothetical protein GOBAR_DD20302 [Gossypium barbadense]|nr:hypothetical protein GOBAR_DD20302 [Gossypium barbadense]
MKTNRKLKKSDPASSKVEKGFALSASSKLIACACSNGQVQLFNGEDLGYVGSLLYSKAKSCHGEIDLFCPKAGENNFLLAPTLPDAVACQFISEKLGYQVLCSYFSFGLYMGYSRISVVKKWHDPSSYVCWRGMFRMSLFCNLFRLMGVECRKFEIRPGGLQGFWGNLGFAVNGAISSDGKNNMAVGDCDEGTSISYDLHNSDYFLTQ